MKEFRAGAADTFFDLEIEIADAPIEPFFQVVAEFGRVAIHPFPVLQLCECLFHIRVLGGALIVHGFAVDLRGAPKIDKLTLELPAERLMADRVVDISQIRHTRDDAVNSFAFQLLLIRVQVSLHVVHLQTYQHRAVVQGQPLEFAVRSEHELVGRSRYLH